MMYLSGMQHSTTAVIATVLWKNAQASVVLFKNTQSCLIILNPKIWARNATFLSYNNQYMPAKGSFLLWSGISVACHNLSWCLPPPSFNNLLKMTHRLSESDAFKPNGIAMISSRFWFCYLIFKIFVQGDEHIISALKALEENNLLRLKYCILPLPQVKRKSQWLHLIFRKITLQISKENVFRIEKWSRNFLLAKVSTY